MTDKTAQYHGRRYGYFFLRLALLAVFLVVAQWGGFSLLLERAVARGFPAHFFLRIVAYLAVFHGVLFLVFSPLSYLAGYDLERRFGLSNESFAQWLRDEAKAGMLGFAILAVGMCFFYGALAYCPRVWWLCLAGGWFAASFLLMMVAPLWILPLFFPVKRIEDEALTRQICAMAERARVNVKGVYEMVLSRKTKKANAALAGIGRTKRILLGDNLLKHFNTEEIMVVLCHEIAHDVRRHALKIWFFSGVIAALGLYILSAGASIVRYRCGTGIENLATYPALYLGALAYQFFTMPLLNMLSRHFEREADRFALQITKARNAFVSTMTKLGEMNLAERSPHPLIEFWFYSHPNIGKRIRRAQAAG